MTSAPEQLLAALLAKRGIAAATAPTIQPGERGDLPLSPAQQRLWFLDRLGHGDSTYLVSTALRLGGPLDVAALEAAWRHVVGRHEPLRTAFTEHGGVPRQTVAPHVAVS
ncbi:MAG TPA: condensation domain-containing protein, partial [Pilimelia sp.]|nr:condensation domain-containing protein [Pilimelia sp.]